MKEAGFEYCLTQMPQMGEEGVVSVFVTQSYLHRKYHERVLLLDVNP